MPFFKDTDNIYQKFKDYCSKNGFVIGPTICKALRDFMLNDKL